mmetsp:Transcript_15147/g.38950  ORF Transcript_15147/g.38950 Transcript_15147/m.38950 type:complete len:224 (+) Transcript_15147:764-1435(+)
MMAPCANVKKSSAPMMWGCSTSFNIVYSLCACANFSSSCVRTHFKATSLRSANCRARYTVAADPWPSCSKTSKRLESVLSFCFCVTSLAAMLQSIESSLPLRRTRLSSNEERRLDVVAVLSKLPASSSQELLTKELLNRSETLSALAPLRTRRICANSAADSGSPLVSMYLLTSASDSIGLCLLPSCRVLAHTASEWACASFILALPFAAFAFALSTTLTGLA